MRRPVTVHCMHGREHHYEHQGQCPFKFRNVRLMTIEKPLIKADSSLQVCHPCSVAAPVTARASADAARARLGSLGGTVQRRSGPVERVFT